MRQIVPCRLMIEDVQGTWKLSQNKAAEARHGAADSVETACPGSDAEVLAQLMRGADHAG